MTLQCLTPRQTRRRMGDPLSWPSEVFLERYTSAAGEDGETHHVNHSDTAVVAGAARRFVELTGVRELLAQIVAPKRVISVDDEDAAELDPRQYEIWFRHLDRIDPEHLAPLQALFREAGVTPRFRGGILSRGRDCPRVAGLLATYAFDAWQDVLMVCQDRPLALKACHEADIHVYSSDEALLASAAQAMQQVGLRKSPGALRHFESEEPDEAEPDESGPFLVVEHDER